MSTLPQWQGMRVAVVATGPSLVPAVRQALAEARSHGHCRILAVNDAGLDIPGTDWLHSNDAGWWQHHRVRAAQFKGFKSSLFPVPGVHIDYIPQISGTQGFDPRPGWIRHGGNSGCAALHLAIQAGAFEVYLFGLDLHGDHYFGPHPQPLRNTAPASFGVFVRRFGKLADELPHQYEGCIVNCTPGSALKVFPSICQSDGLDLLRAPL